MKKKVRTAEEDRVGQERGPGGTVSVSGVSERKIYCPVRKSDLRVRERDENIIILLRQTVRRGE